MNLMQRLWNASVRTRFYPGKRYEDWVLDDPAGQGVDAVRPIRDEIKSRITTLISELIPSS